MEKEDPTMCCLQETHFRFEDTCRLKVKGWKKIFHANGNQKRAGLATLRQNRLYVKKLSQETKKDIIHR